MRAGQVGVDFSQHAPLGSGQRKRQLRQQGTAQPAIAAQARRAAMAALAIQMRMASCWASSSSNFSRCQAGSRRRARCLLRAQSGGGWCKVCTASAKSGRASSRAAPPAKSVGQVFQRQRLADQPAQRALVQPPHGGVDRVIASGSIVVANGVVFRCTISSP